MSRTRIPTVLADHGGDTGRTSKLELDPSIQARVCDRLARGHSVSTPATLAGLDPSTYRTWRRRGKAALEAGEEGPFAEFYSRTQRARAEGMARFEDILIDETVPEDAKGRFGKVMDVLTHRYPETWAAPGQPKRKTPGGGIVIHIDDGEEDIEYAHSPADAT